SSIANDDYVSKWLECSFTEDDETIGGEEDEEKEIEGYKGNLTIEPDDADDETISVQLTQESFVLNTYVENTFTTTATTDTPRPALQPPPRPPPTTTENKSSASFTTISSTGLQELYRLASATEEYDAWVPNSEQLDQLHNHLLPPSLSSSSSVNLTKLEYSQQLLVNTHTNANNNAGWTSSPIDLLEAKPSDNVRM
ncbi:unnamed protein product, partial [Trichobilharzia regenti]